MKLGNITHNVTYSSKDKNRKNNLQNELIYLIYLAKIKTDERVDPHYLRLHMKSRPEVH